MIVPDLTQWMVVERTPHAIPVSNGDLSRALSASLGEQSRSGVVKSSHKVDPPKGLKWPTDRKAVAKAVTFSPKEQTLVMVHLRPVAKYMIPSDAACTIQRRIMRYGGVSSPPSTERVRSVLQGEKASLSFGDGLRLIAQRDEVFLREKDGSMHEIWP